MFTVQNFQNGQSVRALIPIQIPGWAQPSDPGYIYTISKVDYDAGKLIVYRNEPLENIVVNPADMEPHYKAPINGVYYDYQTPDSVVRALENARSRGTRIRLHYGSAEGKDWLEEWDREGRVSCSMGPIKVPLLIHNNRSLGGGPILDASIVKITTATKPHTVLYKHANYHHGKITLRDIGAHENAGGGKTLHELGYHFALDVDDSGHANFKTRQQRDRYIMKMGLTV
jgi:hypothetical protein